jgi:hypothetical protein
MQLEKDFEGTMKRHVGRFFAYSSPSYYSVGHRMLDAYTRKQLTALAGPFEEIPKAPSPAVDADAAIAAANEAVA